MTDRLYYTDPYLREFEATVARVEQRGDRVFVTLDRTAFYPTSGGQPYDTGLLGPLRVVDVVDEEDGSITHVLEAATMPSPPTTEGGAGSSDLEPGRAVHGNIDWRRRFDHMQQHTGQHVLSAAFDKLFGVRTLSFHLGAAVSTIDLAREMSPAEIAAAEEEANRIVWEDRPVAIRFVDAEEAARLPLRKEPARGGRLRLIDVDGFDLSACGGTHVARTGGIGVIAVASWERFKGGQRLEFLCGGRALNAYRLLRDSTSASVRLLSVLPMEVPGAIERLQTEGREHKRVVTRLQDDLARYKADELALNAEQRQLTTANAGPDQRFRLVTHAVDGDANTLKALAAAIAARPGFVVALASSSTPALLVIARSTDIPLSAQHLVASIIAELGGRGGGRSEMSQAGGLNATVDAIFGLLRSLL
jgi:alanyl-tRNA synthetase